MSDPSVLGEYYEEYWSERGFAPRGSLSPETRRLLNTLVPVGTAVVDVGCGDGRAVGGWAIEHGNDYRGFDVARGAVDRARAAGLRADMIGLDGRLPLNDGEAPVVSCLEVLEHLFDPSSMAAELRRVLTNDGILIVSVPNSAYWVRRLELGLLGRINPYGDNLSVDQPWRDPHIRFFTRGSLRQFLETAGFARVQIRGDAHSVFSLRTRIENLAPYRALMNRSPSLLAPTLLASARAGRRDV